MPPRGAEHFWLFSYPCVFNNFYQLAIVETSGQHIFIIHWCFYSIKYTHMNSASVDVFVAFLI